MKKLLREKYLGLRNTLDVESVLTKSNQIIRNIKQQFNLDDYECYAFYMPLGNEVNLKPLMEELISKNKKVVLPKVINKTTMEFFPITDLNDVQTSRFGVLEPNSNEKTPKNEIDIMFIPGIAFSTNYYRLGFGAGYYDRYLVDYKSVKVGICFHFQLINEDISESHDIPMDLIITENHVHPFRDEDLS